jgi:predicted nucleic acid-binding protein
MTDIPRVGVYLDTNVFIELLDRRTVVTQALWKLFGPEAGRSHQIVTSELTLSEILVGAIDLALTTNNYAKHDLFVDSLMTKGNEQLVVPVDRTVLTHAALLRAQLPRFTDRKIKLPDAIHLATALQMKCSFFVTGDKGLRNAVNDVAAGTGMTQGLSRASACEAVDISVENIAILLDRLGIK